MSGKNVKICKSAGKKCVFRFLRVTTGSAKRVLAIVILSGRHDPVPIQAKVR